MSKEIKFSDLNLLLKLAIVGGLISLFVNGIAFIVGFVSGLAYM